MSATIATLTPMLKANLSSGSNFPTRGNSKRNMLKPGRKSTKDGSRNPSERIQREEITSRDDAYGT